MKLIYGTTNASKLASMKRVSERLDVEIIGLKELNVSLPVVEENGNDPLENAIIKAKAYYKVFGQPVFSCDSGLYFEGLSDQLQPGTHVRRIGDKDLSDDEMIGYYSSLAKDSDKPLIGRYHNAICLVTDEDHVYTLMDESIASDRFILGSVPHSKRLPGYPLDSLSIDIETGKYYYDMGALEVDKSAILDGVCEFFRKTLFDNK